MIKSLKYLMGDLSVFFPVTNHEKWMLVVKSILVVLLLDWFFYRSFIAILPLLPVGIKYFQLEKAALIRKKQEGAKEQFKELLLLVSGGQKAGYSADNAFLSSYGEMQSLYGKESSICRMLQVIRIAKENRRSLAEAWYEIGEKTGIREICEFAGIYEISYQSSGNVADIMERTAGIIVEKMDTEKEILVLLGAKRLEQKIMNAMPFLIMLYIMVTSPGYFSELYHTITGVIIMSICLGIYLLSYWASLKIIDISL